MSNNKHYLCEITDIEDPGSRGFSLGSGDATINGFLVRHDGLIHAYVNACPHTGSPLDWVEHQFLDLDKAFIQCAVHDARFDIPSGQCVAGPCVGDNLQRLDAILDETSVYLQADIASYARSG